MPSVALPANYTFVALHATGSHGVIMRAVGPDGSPCAIKAANPDWHFPPALFRREVDIQSSLRIHGVIPVLDRWSGEAGEAMALPWLPCKLSGQGPLKPAVAVDILVKLANTLQSLHAEGVVHRDITPDNILFSSPESLEPWLGDFGLAVRMGETEVPAVRPTPGFVLTNPADAWDTRQDTHGLAASVWSAISGGGPPPLNRSCKALMAQARMAGNPVPERVARQFSRWLRRPPSAISMVREAEQLKIEANHAPQRLHGIPRFFSKLFRYFMKWFQKPDNRHS